MARKSANGTVLTSLQKTMTPKENEHSVWTFNFHANGHILRNYHYNGKSVTGWKQWAIVPIWGMGSVVTWLKSQGYIEVM